MICNTCGKSIQNEEANFCEYCGASIRSRNDFGGSDYHTKPSPPPVTKEVIINQNDKPVSFFDWLGTYLILFIPLVGSLIFFVLLIVWSFSRNVSESRKNWARATLVYILIVFIILVFIISIFGSDQFLNLINEEINQYNNML
ncbi:MAG: zinc-ribbon domain-containing protein [Bacillota bacterium]|nr:zinc-ribbon domain-containing protein [Bacillota bacterium]